jgi:hypothetical protein
LGELRKALIANFRQVYNRRTPPSKGQDMCWPKEIARPNGHTQESPPPRTDDAAVKQAIANVVKDRGTYGYRRVWAHLRLDGHDRVNQKRVYLVMRDKGWLMYRHGENLSTPESMKTKWQSKTAMCDGVQIALSCHATTVRKCGWHLRWTAATGKS